MGLRAPILVAAIAILAIPGAVRADDGAVPQAAPSGEAATPGSGGASGAVAARFRPGFVGVAPEGEPSPTWFGLTPRSPLKTCVDTGFRCSGSGLDWSGSVSLLELPRKRTLVGTGWGMKLDDGGSQSQRIVTAGVRQTLVSGLWIQIGAGAASGQETFAAELGRFDTREEFLPAASAGLGIDVVSRRKLELDFAINVATAIYFEDLSIYNMNVGLFGKWL